MTADYSRLTQVLLDSDGPLVTLSWQELDEIVGELPASATKHYPQWWHGDRAQTRGWRRAGFELASVEVGRTVRFRRAAATPISPVRRAGRTPVRAADRLQVDVLSSVDRRDAMVVLGCSSEKVVGGQLPEGAATDSWPRELLDARARILPRSNVDGRYVLPAWRRYAGHFYRNAGDAVPEAIANGRVAILSGGYGIVRGDEPIAYYDRKLRLSDWPAGILEHALTGEAHRLKVTSVVAFVSATSDYAKLLRRTRWADDGIDALLVTIEGVSVGAQREVPRRLAQAFSAFWRRSPGDYPQGLVVERLA